MSNNQVKKSNELFVAQMKQAFSLSYFILMVGVRYLYDTKESGKSAFFPDGLKKVSCPYKQTQFCPSFTFFPELSLCNFGNLVKSVNKAGVTL